MPAARNYPLLLAVNGVIAGLLFILVLLLVRRLVKRLRQGRFGARMMMRFSIAFALMGVLPGVLIYVVSTQFLARSIESWFDVRVDRALDRSQHHRADRRRLRPHPGNRLPRALHVRARAVLHSEKRRHAGLVAGRGRDH